MMNYNKSMMCLPHYNLASIFQVIDKIEHAVNTTIIEYYGQADKKKFTEAVDKAQQEVRENLDKVSCREKTKNYSTLEKIFFFQSVNSGGSEDTTRVFPTVSNL